MGPNCFIPGPNKYIVFASPFKQIPNKPYPPPIVLRGHTDCLSHTSAGSARYNPGPSGFGRLEQSFAENSFQLGLEVKVQDSPLDGNEKLGELQPPMFGQKLQYILCLCVKTAKSYILKYTMCYIYKNLYILVLSLLDFRIRQST